MTDHPPFYAARNDTDSQRYAQELWGVKHADNRGWCAITMGISTSMMSTRERAEADAAKLNAAAGWKPKP